MYRWFPGLEPTTLLDLYIPKTIHKLTPWSRVLELNQFKAGCSRLHDRPDHSAWSLLTVTIRFLESHNLVCYHYTKAGICTRHIFNSSLKGRCVSRERLLYVSYVIEQRILFLPYTRDQLPLYLFSHGSGQPVLFLLTSALRQFDLWRRVRDSNPKGFYTQLFSRQPDYQLSQLSIYVVGEVGFEPTQSKDNRFTVCPDSPTSALPYICMAGPQGFEP